MRVRSYMQHMHCTLFEQYRLFSRINDSKAVKKSLTLYIQCHRVPLIARKRKQPVYILQLHAPL